MIVIELGVVMVALALASAAVGCYLDTHGITKDPPIYWALGLLTGITGWAYALLRILSGGG